ncbi:conserved hypothetical protein [Ricinus communis]|uniref:Transposase MuDR plant domain-containing protein n=1 Tax=Ricinus communis TaxID=3988 RepID=B9RIZ9_RICCO|nr:conserved hypothetical protein [Ricinus communis]
MRNYKQLRKKKKDKEVEEVVGAEPPINKAEEPQQAKDDEVRGSSDENDGNSSQYFNIIDEEEYYIESDVECGDSTLRRKSSLIKFDRDNAVSIFCLGIVFPNIQQVRDAIAKYATLKGLRVLMKKNEPGRLRAKCARSPSYPWTLFVSKEKLMTI